MWQSLVSSMSAITSLLVFGFTDTSALMHDDLLCRVLKCKVEKRNRKRALLHGKVFRRLRVWHIIPKADFGQAGFGIDNKK